MIQKTTLDLNVESTHNIKTLAIADMSFYANTPSGATLEITPPNFTKVTIPFHFNEVNVYNSNTLKLSSVIDPDLLGPLPDGIWKLRYSIQPASTTFIQRKFFRTNAIECKYQNIFLSVDLFADCSTESSYCLPNSNKYKNKIDKIKEIELMINGAISAANRGEDDYAMMLYKRADSLLTNFSNCQTCK